jgi:hypothetical protein
MKNHVIPLSLPNHAQGPRYLYEFNTLVGVLHLLSSDVSALRCFGPIRAGGGTVR